MVDKLAAAYADGLRAALTLWVEPKEWGGDFGDAAARIEAEAIQRYRDAIEAELLKCYQWTILEGGEDEGWATLILSPPGAEASTWNAKRTRKRRGANLGHWSAPVPAPWSDFRRLVEATDLERLMDEIARLVEEEVES